MPNPKGKTSKRMRGHRRSHHKIDLVSTVKCPSCGDAIKPHTVCPSCGKYREEQIVEVSEI